MKPPQKSDIVVCGIVRDVEDTVSKEISRLKSALREFQNIAFVIVESLSTDKTTSILSKIRNQVDSFEFESISHYRDLELTRSQRLAEARNAAMQIQTSKFSNADYVYVVDLDGVNRDLSLDGVMSCWNYGDWDVMTSNQPRGYYDILALRHDYWCHYNWGAAFEELIKYFPKDTAAEIALKSKSVKISKSNPLIPVKSAFGGGAIYTAAAFSGRKYSGLDRDGQEVCEHVPLNLEIHDAGGSIFINPKLVNVRHLGRSHSIRKRIKNKLN